MLKALLKKQLMEIFRGYFYDAKQGKQRSRALTTLWFALFALLMVGVLGGVFTFLSLTLCAPLSEAGMDWLYFALMSLIAVALGAFGSVFNTYSGLYLAKDNDLLLSMPIPVRTIMTARLLGVYLLGLMYSGVVTFPAAIVYAVTVSASPRVLAGMALLILLVSVFVLTLSCALGWVVARLSVRLKHKSLTAVLLSLGFIGVYYLVYFKAQEAISGLLLHAAEYGSAIRSAAYPLYLLGRAATGDGQAMLLVTLAVAGLFALLWALMARSFLWIAASSAPANRKARQARAAKPQSVCTALLRKEFSRFLASPNYMLNCGMGALLLPIGGVLLLFKGREAAELLQNSFSFPAGGVTALMCSLVCLLAAMNDLAAPSVSLEGKSLWIVQSLPVSSWQVLRAKLLTQLLLTAVPTLFCALCICLTIPCAPTEKLLLTLTALAYALLMAHLDLALGVKMPNLSWTNELFPIKQSLNVMLALFGGWLCALLPVGGYLLLGEACGAAGSLLCMLAAMLLLCAPLHVWLRKKGAERFAAL